LHARLRSIPVNGEATAERATLADKDGNTAARFKRTWWVAPENERAPLLRAMEARAAEWRREDIEPRAIWPIVIKVELAGFFMGPSDSGGLGLQ
jgi:hypothetical protein